MEVIWRKKCLIVYFCLFLSILVYSCLFFDHFIGITVQEKVIKSIKRSCNMEQYGLNKSNIEDFVNVNLSVYQWNPDILEKIATAFTLTCKVHNMIYEPFDVHKVDAKDYYKLAVAPDMVKTYHCFLLGRQAERLLESLILKKNFVKFKVEDAIDVYEFFYVTRILSKNPREDFELFLKNKKEYQKKQKDEIIKNSKLDENVTDILFQNYECYWFKSYENFKSLWMHAASKFIHFTSLSLFELYIYLYSLLYNLIYFHHFSFIGNLGPGAYLRNFFSEIWNNMGTLFKKQSKVRDVEYFNSKSTPSAKKKYKHPIDTYCI